MLEGKEKEKTHTYQVLISRDNLINLIFRKSENHSSLNIFFCFFYRVRRGEGWKLSTQRWYDVGRPQKGKEREEIKSSPLVMDSTNSLSVLGGRRKWCVGYSAT